MTQNSYSSMNNLNYFDNNDTEIITAQSVIIPIWLRDTYATILSTPLYAMAGYSEEYNIPEVSDKIFRNYSKTTNGNYDNIDDAKNIIFQLQNNKDVKTNLFISEGKNTNFFISGGDVFGYLNRHLDREICNYTVSIVIRGLRDLYWNNRLTLPRDEDVQLDNAMRQPLPSFKNIFDYDEINTIEGIDELIDIPVYQLFGTITPYSVIHIPVRHFIQSLNINAPIRVALADTNIIIQLDYQQFDFWDSKADSIIKYINLNSRCM